MRIAVITRAIIRRRATLGAVLTVALLAASFAGAQPRRPQATLTPSVVTRDLAPGRNVELELKVVLPPDVHVQANKPSDPLYIPTVLTIEAPVGVTVDAIVYPPSEKLTQKGVADPLVVFGSEFIVRARVSLAATVPAGDLAVPGRLRYQACDATTCYPPTRADAIWTLPVRPRS